MTLTHDDFPILTAQERAALCRIDVESFTSELSLISVSGEIDLVTAPDLEAALERANSHTAHTVVDLSAVTFLSLAGAYIVNKARTARNDQLHVFAPTDPACQVLALASRHVDSSAERPPQARGGCADRRS